MKPFPSIPSIDAVPELTGHLWLTEQIDGAPFRFRLQDTGRIQFGDGRRVYETATAVPDPYQHAVRHVQTRLDRHALERAVGDVDEIVFFTVATQKQTIDYDWERLPSVLGVDIWSETTGRFRPPDAVDAIFDRLGLTPVNVFERERRARDFDPDSYAIPQSAWYDGPPKGVVIRTKQGDRAILRHPEFEPIAEPEPIDASPTACAAQYATQQRFERLASSLADRGQPVTVETLYERTLESITREAGTRLSRWDGDMAAFRSEVAALTTAFLTDRDTAQ